MSGLVAAMASDLGVPIVAVVGDEVHDDAVHAAAGALFLGTDKLPKRRIATSFGRLNSSPRVNIRKTTPNSARVCTTSESPARLPA